MVSNSTGNLLVAGRGHELDLSFVSIRAVVKVDDSLAFQLTSLNHLQSNPGIAWLIGTKI